MANNHQHRKRFARMHGVERMESRLMRAGMTLDDFYTEGKGSGLSLQELEGFALATTYETTIDGLKTNSALQGAIGERETGNSPLRENFEFNPAFAYQDPAGNLVGWNPDRGGTAPWLIRPELVGQPGAARDLEYPKRNFPDSAATATTLFTGVKTFNHAVGVDIFEQPAESLLEVSQALEKATGVVTNVPIDHATAGAASAHHNNRLDRDVAHPDLDNTLQQQLLQTKPTVLLGGGHPLMGSDKFVKSTTLDALRDPSDGVYDDWVLVERGPDASTRLAEIAQQFDSSSGSQLVGIFGARSQAGNLPWATADGDFSNTGIPRRTPPTRILEADESVDSFIARERDENPRLFQLVNAALDVVEDDPDGFWLMVEGGDIDWAMHDSSLDNAVGAVLEFDLAVERVLDWIDKNGGFDETLLIVTADHDHYLNLNANYPELAADGIEGLTPTAPSDLLGNPEQNGHYWGANPSVQFTWNTHTTIPVPVYYQGPRALMEMIDSSVGQGFSAYGHPIPGVDGMIDQVHLHDVMRTALEDGMAKNVIVMVPDGMGWEMARAAAIAKQLQSRSLVEARLDEEGTIVVTGTDADDQVRVRQAEGNVLVESANDVVPVEVAGEFVDYVPIDSVRGVEFLGGGGNDQFLVTGLSFDAPESFTAGDANRDHRFDPFDIVQVLQNAKYLTGEAASWEEGDWTEDGIFDQLDIVAALQTNSYLR